MQGQSNCRRRTAAETPNEPNRRDVVAGISGAIAVGMAGVGAAPSPARAAGAVGAAMAERATSLLAALSPGEREQATFAFGSSTWRRWNYMLGSAYANGLAMERMSADQKTKALDLLGTALNGDGMRKAEKIMIQQDILRDLLKKGSPQRNRERFSVAIFGTPSIDAPWGWRWEGHHLSLSFTLLGHEVVSVTPSSFSSEPNTVVGGPHKGMVALEYEEVLGRRIVGDLDAKRRASARIRERSFGNVLALAGREGRLTGGARSGVRLADLPQAQVDLVRRLVELYTVDHLVSPLAATQRERLTEGDLMAATFGWAGNYNTEGASIYYRLHGDTFAIEFASLFNQPLHLHTIRHDFERNLGVHAI